jgi:hypothetical protein
MSRSSMADPRDASSPQQASVVRVRRKRASDGDHSDTRERNPVTTDGYLVCAQFRAFTPPRRPTYSTDLPIFEALYSHRPTTQALGGGSLGELPRRK